MTRCRLLSPHPSSSQRVLPPEILPKSPDTANCRAPSLPMPTFAPVRLLFCYPGHFAEEDSFGVGTRTALLPHPHVQSLKSAARRSSGPFPAVKPNELNLWDAPVASIPTGSDRECEIKQDGYGLEPVRNCSAFGPLNRFPGHRSEEVH